MTPQEKYELKEEIKAEIKEEVIEEFNSKLSIELSKEDNSGFVEVKLYYAGNIISQSSQYIGENKTNE